MKPGFTLEWVIVLGRLCFLGWFVGAALLSTGSSLAQQRAAAGAALAPVQAGGAIRAVVIGIDTYKNPDVAPPLRGAVADAEDIARSLRTAGVSDLVVLTESAATRAAVLKALGEIEQRATAKDLIVLTFAGHGGRQPERVPGSEPDGLDEIFILWGYDFIGRGAEEYVLDDEMRIWLERLSKRAGHVVFLADSCFGGGMTKQIDPRITPLPVRALPQRPPAKAPVNLSGAAQIPKRDNATSEWSNISFIAAVDDATPAMEVWAPGEPTPRGAASYAFARAVAGKADLEGDRDGLTTRRELFAYVRRQIRRVSSDRQYPITEPRRQATANTPVFRSGRLTEPERRPPAQSPLPSASAKVASRGAELVQDSKTGDIIDASGAVVAYSKSAAAFETAQLRLSAYRSLQALSDGRGLDLDISPPDRDFKIGDRFTLTAADGVYGQYLILIDLAGDGTVQYLFPRGRVDPYWDRDSLVQDIQVSEPPGADTLVLIATSERRVALELALSGLDGKVQPMALVDELTRQLGPDDRIGLATYTTRR